MKILEKQTLYCLTSRNIIKRHKIRQYLAFTCVSRLRSSEPVKCCKIKCRFFPLLLQTHCVRKIYRGVARPNTSLKQTYSEKYIAKGDHSYGKNLSFPIIFSKEGTNNTVNSRYLDFGYLEQLLISKKKSGPCYNTEI